MMLLLLLLIRLLLLLVRCHGHPHQYHGWARVPTISPYPTETAVPSPSPSEVPSFHPSYSPSLSLIPTSSLEPSVSPTDSPSTSPSSTPTYMPSVVPSQGPSIEPSLSLSPTITPNPTGPVFMAAKDVQVLFQGITQPMEDSHIDFFEEETKTYLQKHILLAPAILSIEIEAVTVTDQDLVGAHRQRRELKILNWEQQQESQSLLVSMQVVATVLVDRDSLEHFDLKEFLDIFFENYDNLQGLRQTLEQQDEFASFWKPTVSSSAKQSVGGSIAGSVFGVAVSCIGFAGIWIWSRKRRHRLSEREEKHPDYLNQLTFTHSYDTDDCLPPGTGRGLQLTRIAVDSATLEVRELSESTKSKCDVQNQSNMEGDGSELEEEDEIDASDFENHSDIEESMESMVKPPPHLMYTPALMTTESNIEVPDTPQTAFFTLHGARSNLTTPVGSGTKSEHSSSAHMPADTKRKAILPKLWQTTFRRNTNDSDEEDPEDDDSDAVVFASARKSSKSAGDRFAIHPPIEIGGPEIVNEIAYLHSRSGGNDAESSA